jgi:molybdenum-dependent DNA-binding transcriptional regulator ModE
MPSPMLRVDPGLYQFCTVRQLEVLEAVNVHKGLRAAARALGINKTGVEQALKQVERKAAFHGYSPKHDLTHTVAPGQKLQGASTLYREGKQVLQWVKTSADDQQREQIMREAVAALMDDVPRTAPTAYPVSTAQSLCNVITLTDVHVGAYAWGKETGADWDLSIAERDVTGAVRNLLEACPKAGTCVIAQLGDFLHQDGLAAVTPTSGHQLDSDSRFSKVVQVAIRILRAAVDMALQRHQRVVVLVAEGNHDLASSVWLRHLFSLLYEREPRVSVIDSELPYYCHQHGQTMLAWHHGHLKKLDQLPLLFAAQFPKVWGDTSKRYVHTGHLHHKHEKEHSGVTVIQHPTIAARDAYAARGGWVADREMTAITYSDRWGQVARATVCPEMLGA